MVQDPLDPIKKIQAHLEALRRVQNFPVNISNPQIDASGLRIQFKGPGGPAPGLPPVPDPLIDWLLEDLPPKTFHDLVIETVAALKIKGYRSEHVPRAEGVKLLKKRYDKEPPFRFRVTSLWMQSRQKEDGAFRLIKADALRRDPWPAIERFGFPVGIWLFVLSQNGAFRQVALNILKEVTSKEGKLSEILEAAARNRTAEQEKIWSLPSLTRNEEMARIQTEAEQAFTERDRWQRQAEEEKRKCGALETDLRQAREENQKLAHARAAADQTFKQLELRAKELETHLEKLRGAESALKQQEKHIKELEHDKAQFTKTLNEFEAARLSLARERDAFAQTNEERESALRLFAKALTSPVLEKPAFQGQALLLITKAEAAPFFEAAKKAGLTLLVHDGKAHNTQLYRLLERTWRILIWGDFSSFPEGVRNALRNSSKPLDFSPELGPAVFERLLAGASRLWT
ncbi:MAG: hypothetical protein HY548_01815 [Elusimicrobia bacterium]|nr:hypothetical protein [Elusimicrobiota bacterium]